MRNKIFKFFATLSVIISLACLLISIYEYNRIDRYYYKYGDFYANILTNERKEKIIETLNKYPFRVPYEGLIVPGVTPEPQYENLTEDFKNILNSYQEMEWLVDETYYYILLKIIPLNIILFLISLYFFKFSFQVNSNKKN